MWLIVPWLYYLLCTKCYDIKLSNPCSKNRRTVLKLESDSEEEVEEDCQRYTMLCSSYPYLIWRNYMFTVRNALYVYYIDIHHICVHDNVLQYI